jgi:predicted DNA-binding transcriptional regulator YafY
MRADRLLSLLMLLQSRGQMRARELAKELEVSERTIYRDIDALSATGVPIYSDFGPDGGYSLLDSYRTTLTGMTEREVRALFMLNIPAPLADIGLYQELRTALQKMSASLPATLRKDEEQVRKRFYIDSTWWSQGDERVPHLQTIHQAVWEDRWLDIKVRPPFAREIEWRVAPYGLVAKAGVWYLVCERKGRIRVERVSELLNAQINEDNFERPTAFDLAGFWEEWCSEYEALSYLYRVLVRVAPGFISLLPKYFGNQIQDAIKQGGAADEEGWHTLELSFESFQSARDRILGFGRGVEVLEPHALRMSVLDIAEQIVNLYTN